MKVKFEHEISNKLLSGVLCSAFEGGTNYWCQIQGYKNMADARKEFKLLGIDPEDKEFRHLWVALTEKGVMVLGEDEEDIGEFTKIHELTRDKLERGLQIMAKQYPRHMSNLLNENYDAETGDVLIQCALLGRITYG